MAGTYFGPTLGNTVANLRAAGYTPKQVDEVGITHMHADHIGELVHDGKRAFLPEEPSHQAAIDALRLGPSYRRPGTH